MWKFIKYLFYCLGILFDASFGYHPESYTWKEILIGAGTLVLLIAIAALLFYLSFHIINVVLKAKK